MTIKVNGYYPEEGSYGGKLDFLGKLCRYIEEFHGVKITEEDLIGLIKYDNIMESNSFQFGYERASALIENGFNQRLYSDWLLRNQNEHPELYVLYSKIITNIRGREEFKKGHFKG